MFKRLLNEEHKKITVTAAVMAVLTAALGIFLHYAFELSGKNLFVGLFSSVNESTWEHLKLLFMPYAFFMIFEYSIYGKDRRNFFSAKLIGILCGMESIVMNYYFYTGAFGVNYSAVNIILYFLGVIVAYAVALWIMVRPKRHGGGLWESLAILCMGAICAAFFFFTLYPPMLPIFRDPVSMLYGIT